MSNRLQYSRGKRADLTSACKRGLVILLEGCVTRVASGWQNEFGKLIRQETIEALFERYLVKIVVESRHRRRHTATLTDVGAYAARTLKADFDLVPAQEYPVSQESSLMISELTS